MENKKNKKLKEESTAYNLNNKNYTYEDILNFNDKNRYEIIEGTLFVMESARPKHQMYVGEIFNQIYNYLKGKPCKVIVAPSEVKLTTQIFQRTHSKIKDSVQPDIYVVCDASKFDDTGIYGVPDMIIEIVSPSNKKHDTITKFNLYQKYGVKEYWIVDIEEEKIQVFLLNEEKEYYLEKEYKTTDNIKVNIFENLEICLKEFYEENKELLDRI